MALPTAWTRPSVARAYIEAMWPVPINQVQGNWDSVHLETVAGLVEVLNHLDERVLYDRLTAKEGIVWRRHGSAIRAVVRRWENGGEGRLNYLHALALHGLLAKCPDEIVPRAAPRLTFIVDDKLRESIARDVDSLEGFLRDSEWKAATVIGGSVVEALLLAGLLDKREEAQAFEKERNAAEPRRWRIEPLEDWKLWKMIAVAEAVGLINDVVARVCDGARDFRNLIHAGKERAEAPSDKGTAHAAVAAVENLLATFSGERG
jgi:hypothetical protein